VGGRLTRWRTPAAYDTAVAVVLGLVIMGPLLLGRGFALVGDMVFVPDQPWKDLWLGADGSVPRAVPSDAVVWALTLAVPGDLVQKAVLVGIVVGGALGMARFVEDAHPAARTAAAVLYVWNPFVYERLAIGHWALLVGYAALPWVARAAHRLGSGAGGWPALAVPLAVAGWSSPTGGVLAVMVAVAVLLGRWRRAALALTLGLVLNLPWIVPGFVALSGPGDPFGVEAFAARSDTSLGVLGSLLTFGGLWKESVHAPGREATVLALAALLLSIAGLLGLAVARQQDRHLRAALAGLGAVGLLLAAAPATEAGRAVVEVLVSDVPGGGLLRDSQKWVALLVLAVCWGLAHLLEEARRRVHGTHAAWWGVAAALLPVAVLPSLAWGANGVLEPVDYPESWSEARAALEQAGSDEGRVLVLPFAVYRRYDWNDDRAMLDPSPRFFPGELVVDDALVVEEGTVAGEDPLAARIREVADDRDALSELLVDEGIGWVLVDDDAGVPVTIPPGRTVYDGASFRLVRVPGAPAEASAERHWIVYAAGATAVATIIGVFVTARRRPSPYSVSSGA
jgi:hypothetical protein